MKGNNTKVSYSKDCGKSWLALSVNITCATDRLKKLAEAMEKVRPKRHRHPHWYKGRW